MGKNNSVRKRHTLLQSLLIGRTEFSEVGLVENTARIQRHTLCFTDLKFELARTSTHDFPETILIPLYLRMRINSDH